MSDLAALQCRYGSTQQHRGISASPSRDDRGNPTSRPEPGDTVSVTDLDGVFTVESFDGALYTLRSEHGVMLHAGVLAVRKAEHGELV